MALFETAADPVRHPTPARRRRTEVQRPPQHVDLDLGSLDPIPATPGSQGAPAGPVPVPVPALMDRDFGLLLDEDLAALIEQQQDLVARLDRDLNEQLADAQRQERDADTEQLRDVQALLQVLQNEQDLRARMDPQEGTHEHFARRLARMRADSDARLRSAPDVLEAAAAAPSPAAGTRPAKTRQPQQQQQSGAQRTSGRSRS
jgi:hypothetical protein